MNHFALRFGTSVAAVILSLGISTITHAQDFRSNPFLPETTSQEQEIIAERERIRQSIREMMPEIKSLLASTLEEQKTQILSEVAANVAALPAPMTDSDGNIIPNTPEAEAPTSAIPEGSKWIACINGKALYRDSNGIKFFVETDEAADQCS